MFGSLGNNVLRNIIDQLISLFHKNSLLGTEWMILNELIGFSPACFALAKSSKVLFALWYADPCMCERLFQDII